MTLFEKVVTVLAIAPATELGSGDLLFIVEFGETIDRTPEIAARLPPAAQGSNRINVTYLGVWVKSATLPYTIGSKWKLSVADDGKISLVQSQ